MSRYPKPRSWTPRNIDKYVGDHTKIVSRSSWELRTFKWLDDNPNVLEWSSEEIAIAYRSPVDKKLHRYFPDIYAKFKTSDNRTKTYLIEIKPEYQANEPKIKKNITKQYVNEVCTYVINQEKWRAATEYCLDRKWEFKVITEKDLFNG
jgi:predicted nucleotidyltransferase